MSRRLSPYLCGAIIGVLVTYISHHGSSGASNINHAATQYVASHCTSPHALLSAQHQPAAFCESASLAPHPAAAPLKWTTVHTSCDTQVGGQWLERAACPLEWRDDTSFSSMNLPSHVCTPYYVPEPAAAQQSECVITAFDASEFLQSLQGRTLSLFGDSMMRQLFGQLTVMLLPHLRATHEYTTFSNASDVAARKHARYNPVRVYYYDHNVTIKSQWVTGWQMYESMAATMLRSDLMVVNVGAFFDQPHQLQYELERFVEQMKTNYAGQWIWREYSPTHFDTPDGDYDRAILASKAEQPPRCVQSEQPMKQRQAAWRLHEPNKLMHRHQIPIMPMYDLSSMHSDFHPGHGDCRHWHAPSSVLEAWVTILWSMIRPTGPES